jgi:hypothetical protein
MPANAVSTRFCQKASNVQNHWKISAYRLLVSLHGVCIDSNLSDTQSWFGEKNYERQGEPAAATLRPVAPQIK